MSAGTGGGKPPPPSPDLDRTALSRSGTLARRMQEIALGLLREHEADHALPTNLRFLFYEASSRGHVRKSEKGESRRGPRLRRCWRLASAASCTSVTPISRAIKSRPTPAAFWNA